MKYHVNSKTGRAGQCKATKKGCPLGADTPHFNTKEEAQAHIESSAKANNSTFNKLSKNTGKVFQVKKGTKIHELYENEADQREFSKMLKGKTLKVSEFEPSPGDFTPAQFTLSDGSSFRVTPNFGGCSCGAGDYDITMAKNFNKPIEKLSFEGNGYGPGYSIYAFGKGDKRGTKILQVDGHDDSGYYGTGYSIEFTEGSKSPKEQIKS